MADNFVQVKDYSVAAVREYTNDFPVLDLSCKKPTPSPSSSIFFGESSVSPLRGSTQLNEYDERNNNDNKEHNKYLHQKSRRCIVRPVERNTQHRSTDDSGSSSSNQDRKSPFENRSYIMTPPSESSSPKRAKFQSIRDHSDVSMAGIPHNTLYSMMPMAIPPQSMASSILPSLLSQNPINPLTPVHTITSSMPVERSSSSSLPDESLQKKGSRPFKAYPKDSLVAPLGSDLIFNDDIKSAYGQFRNRLLDSVKKTDDGLNTKMRRISKSSTMTSSPADDKDIAYWERRRKNNEAAKRSRDARRAKEDEIAIRAAFLEQEYIKLKYENVLLREKIANHKCMWYQPDMFRVDA